MKAIEFPMVVLLTHRRGAALALLRDNFDVHEQNMLFIRTSGKTAENLLDLYGGIVKFAGYMPQEIKSIAVGVGPGSFTGLRLGCAFANGLKLGQNCQLIAVPTELVSYFLDTYVFASPEERQNFLQELGDYHLEDESTGLVTFYDIIDSIEKLKQKVNFVEVVEPQYGREPGPVLKLRESRNVVSKKEIPEETNPRDPCKPGGN